MILSKYCIVNMDVHHSDSSTIVSADVLQRVQLLRAEEARLLLRRQDRRMKIQLVSREAFYMVLPFQWRFLSGFPVLFSMTKK